MRPCDSCLENNWNFQYVEEYVRATCVFCGNQVDFEVKKKEKMVLGSVCRKCKNGVIIKKNAKKPRVYSAYYFCPSCKEMYMSEEFRIETNT